MGTVLPAIYEIQKLQQDIMADKKAVKSAVSSSLEGLISRLAPDNMSGRMMKYPYTVSAKLAQFPFTYYLKNQWIFKYYFIGVGLSIPVFHWFQKQACSPGNVAKWEAKAKEAH